MKLVEFIHAELKRLHVMLDRSVDDLTPDSRVQDLLDRLRQEWPFLAGYPLAVARNCEVVDLQTRLEQGDEVALLPPLSGGCT